MLAIFFKKQLAVLKVLLDVNRGTLYNIWSSVLCLNDRTFNYLTEKWFLRKSWILS